MARGVAVHLFERNGDFPRPIYLAMEMSRPRRQLYLTDPDVQVPALVDLHWKDGYTYFATAAKAMAKYDQESTEEIPTLLVIYADHDSGEWHSFATIITKDGKTYLGEWKVMKLGDDVPEQQKILPTLMILHGSSASGTPRN